MALQILKKEGAFELSGKLNVETSRSLIIHFEYLINTFKYVTVNISKLEEVDEYGVQALKTLIAISLKSNNIFYIIGNGSKDIYNHKDNHFAA
jgi:ABC-type transporter Mla MlaB component